MAWGLADPIDWTRPTTVTQDALVQHRHATHTYHYQMDGHGDASSRLDSWYVSVGSRYAADRTGHKDESHGD